MGLKWVKKGQIVIDEKAAKELVQGGMDMIRVMEAKNMGEMILGRDLDIASRQIKGMAAQFREAGLDVNEDDLDLMLEIGVRLSRYADVLLKRPNAKVECSDPEEAVGRACCSSSGSCGNGGCCNA